MTSTALSTPTATNTDSIIDSSIIFDKLDPTLRLLLTSIDHLNHAYQHQKEQGQKDVQQLYENILTLYKTQNSLFQGLNHDLTIIAQKLSCNDIDNDNQGSKTQRLMIRKAFHDMEEYITLPIILTLQNYNARKGNHSLQYHNSNNSIHHNNIIINIQNAQRQAIENACTCLNTFVDYLHNDNSSYPNTQYYIVTTMNIKLVIKCIVALSMVLTLLVEYYKKNKNENGIGSNLDKGDDCIQSIFQSLHTLLLLLSKVPKHNLNSLVSQRDQEFVTALYNYVPNGGLILGIVQNCLDCLDDNHHNNDNKDVDDHLKKSLRESMNLKIHSLDVLKALLDLIHYGNHKSSDINNSWNVKDERDDLISCYRRMFPSFFTVLFKQLHHHLRYSPPYSSSKLAVKYMDVLVALLKNTLQQKGQQDISEEQLEGNVFLDGVAKQGIGSIPQSKTVEESTKTLMSAISKLKLPLSNDKSDHNVVDCNVPTNQDNNNNDDDEYKSFIHTVKQRIQFPIAILCKLLPTHSSSKVRMKGVQLLCKCILVDTLIIWNNEDKMSDMKDDSDIRLFHDNIEERAFECLIIMMDDEDKEVVKCCSKIFDLHQLNVNKLTTMKKMDQKTIISIVIEHIQSLSIITRSRRETDLKTRIKLINGYISLLDKKKLFFTDKESSLSCDYFMQKLIVDPCRHCIVDLFTLQDDVRSSSITILSPEHQYKYMREDTTRLAFSFIHKLSSFLGPKRSAVFADELIASIFDSLSNRIKDTDMSTLGDKRHFKWIQHYYGVVIIAKELIKGQAITSVPNESDMKMFKYFAQSILPIIIGDTFWQLPTSFLWASSVNQSGDNTMFTVNKNKLIPTSKAIREITRETSNSSDFDSNIAASALHGNALLISAFMEIIEGLASILGTEFVDFIPAILYPILQKTSDINSVFLQQRAIDTLITVSTSSGYTSFEFMLSTHFRYIIDVFSVELRGSTFLLYENHLRQQAICFYSLHKIIKIMLESLLKEKKFANTIANNHLAYDETTLADLMDMIQTVNTWFNTNFKKNTNSLIIEMTVPLSMVQVFNSCFEYMNAVIEFDKSDITISTIKDESHWTDLLLQFELIENNDKGAVSTRNSTHSPLLSQPLLSSRILMRLSDTIRQVMLTNSVILSLPELRLQREACDLLRQSFYLLHTMQNHCNKLSDNEKSDIGSPLLESISKYWFPIQSRLQSTTLTLCKNDIGDDTARMHHALLLSSLLDLISSISELCDGFIADRFQSTIFPHITKLFESIVYEMNGTNKSIKLPKESYVILEALLKCVRIIFSSNTLQLSPIVPIIGSIIIPFLEFDDDVGNEAMEAMKTLLQIDSDSLWRALYKTSGRNVPPRTLFRFQSKANLSIVPNLDNTKLSSRSRKLLDYIKTLPEQNLLY